MSVEAPRGSMEQLKAVQTTLRALLNDNEPPYLSEAEWPLTAQLGAQIALVLAVQELTDVITPAPRRQVGWMDSRVTGLEPWRRIHDHEFSGTSAGHEFCEPVWVAQ